MSIDDLREERYKQARELWSGNFFVGKSKMEAIGVVNSESLYCFNLENDYNSAVSKIDGVYEESEKKVIALEKQAKKSTEDVQKLEETLTKYKKDKAAFKASVDKEIKSDMSSFRESEKALNKKLEKANADIEKINDAINKIEVETSLQNPRAQELLIELRAMLLQQSKELKLIERKARM